jgi:hypothetical protein
MARLLRAGTLLLIIMTIGSVPARADFWDWMGGLSGPGRFETRGNTALTVYCFHPDFTADEKEGKTGNQRGGNDRFFHLLQDRTRRGPCISFDFRGFRTLKHRDDPRFFPVRVEVYEAGTTYRVWTFLEVGVGAGVIHFNSDGRTKDKMIIDVPRVVFKPLLVVPALQKKRNGGFGFLQMYYRASVIPGKLTQDDFRPKPGTVFQVKNDLVPSGGFMIDPIALARLLANR